MKDNFSDNMVLLMDDKEFKTAKEKVVVTSKQNLTLKGGGNVKS
jgi:hypothetical protein